MNARSPRLEDEWGTMYRDRRRSDRVTVAVLAGSGMLTSLQFTLMVPALPEVPAALGISANDAAWLVTITLLTATVGTPIVARMADMYGRRTLLLVCLALLVGGSVIAASGMTFPTVLAGRALQGFATAILPIGISLMRDLLTRERAASGIALMSGTLGIGSALGLPLSGVLVALGGFAAIFWFSAFAGSVFLVLVLTLVPASTKRTGGRFDLVGAVLLAGALASMLIVISKGLVWGWTSPGILAFAGAAVILFAIWIPQQLHNRDPVVDLRTSTRRPVLQTNIASFFATVGMFANHLLTMHEARAPVAAGSGLGMPAVVAGLILLPSALVMVLLAPVASRLILRAGGRIGLILGATIMASAFAFRLVAHDGVVPVVIGALLVGVGTTFAFAAVPILIMDAVPASEMAAANGVNSLVRSLSGAVTSAAFALVIVAFPSAADPEFLSADGIRVAFAVVGMCGACAAVIAAFLPRPRPGVPS